FIVQLFLKSFILVSIFLFYFVLIFLHFIPTAFHLLFYVFVFLCFNNVFVFLFVCEAFCDFDLLKVTVLFLVQYTSKEFDRSEKTVATGDCCYLNPLVRRTFRFLGVYAFGLFTVDIFVNAGQVVTGNLAPYFLTVCKPNYTALGCQQALRYISHQEACTGNQNDVLRARKTFPSKEAALSVYAALYLTMYVTCTVHAKGSRLAKPVMSLGFMCLAFLTGLNRVAEYRNHWSDVIAGFIIGMAIATFLVRITHYMTGEKERDQHNLHLEP
uniref:Phospholipid phosphatase related 5b n=1 Tax=Fundulus heteroclitus TaxID=8078 RepID=A0A3Q2QMK9_FUNHE